MPEPPGQMMSALDLAKLSRHLITEYAQYYPYFSEREFTWNKIRQPNRDLVLGMLQGADGSENRSHRCWRATASWCQPSAPSSG
jgi:D-alanyl-D-alanine carboxypeptidase